MYTFYLVKYNPLFQDRNWFRLWNRDKTQSIKVSLDPIRKRLICHFGEKEVLTINVSSQLEHQKSFYFTLKNGSQKSVFTLPNNHKLQLSDSFRLSNLETTIWLDVIAHESKTRSQLETQIVDSLSQQADNIKESQITDTDSLSEPESECSSETEQPDSNVLSEVVEQPDAEGVESSSESSSECSSESEDITIAELKPQPAHAIKKPTLGPVLEYLPFKLKKQLSFCQTCLGRLWQIQQTLPINLKHNIPLQDRVEFVVVDFGTPGLYEWISQHFTWALKSGYLRYLRTDKLSYWHASIAKNTSHQYAQGDILTNLDCDNFTGKLGAMHIIKLFEKYGQNIMLHQWSGVSKDGTYGRISCHRDTFARLGGYDESFLPMGYQDHDLIMRFRLLYGRNQCINYQYLSQLRSKYRLFINLYSRAIENDKTNSLQNTGYLDKIGWQEMNDINKRKSHENIIYGKYKVNINHDRLGVFIY